MTTPIPSCIRLRNCLVSAMPTSPGLRAGPLAWNPDRILCLDNPEIHSWSCLSTVNRPCRRRCRSLIHRSRHNAIDELLGSISPEAGQQEEERLKDRGQCGFRRPANCKKAQIKEQRNSAITPMLKAIRTATREKNDKPDSERNCVTPNPLSESQSPEPRTTVKQTYAGNELVIREKHSGYRFSDTQATKAKPSHSMRPILVKTNSP
ncbi:hypothetical protein QBC34DRAFT_139669 [Podospora aff. communis PSN243]|uniref:Uncharacterized protein n=1 Tax=Podospora aff. communis PSN243 TaxID=3040156 RepID=A0AAV9H2W7_9PEZI|nr:hypothetical protein QBC34DRAFT_139669 [Podospora aff. communis PSN243]